MSYIEQRTHDGRGNPNDIYNLSRSQKTTSGFVRLVAIFLFAHPCAPCGVTRMKTVGLDRIRNDLRVIDSKRCFYGRLVFVRRNERKCMLHRRRTQSRCVFFTWRTQKSRQSFCIPFQKSRVIRNDSGVSNGSRLFFGNRQARCFFQNVPYATLGSFKMTHSGLPTNTDVTNHLQAS